MRPMDFRPTIGLEVHAELKTATKMFCSCKNDPDEIRPNVNVCPICLAHPGTLPAINREAVRHVLRVGTAVGGELADFTEFDRKSYFYPDIPKGYQISQYEHPLVSGGELAGVKITRVHLEEDTARSTHTRNKSLVDFNRAGIPLMELVTEPVIHDAETAGSFARELQLLLRTLGAGEANLEKGEMRIEANISVSNDPEKLGTKVEVKNINSFRSVERAIAYEIARQTKLIQGGEKVLQETRGWNEVKQETFSQRLKEGSADYRYFPEPDLPKLVLSEVAEFSPEVLRSSLPELPSERRTRYAAMFRLKKSDIDFLASPERSVFFDAIAGELENDAELVALGANYFISDLAGEAGAIEPASFAKLIRMIRAAELSSRGAKDVLTVMRDQGGDPRAIAKKKGVLQVHDTEALRQAVLGVIEAHASVVADYKAGKEAALQFLVGQAMKVTKGSGNPALLHDLFVEELKK
jgi:aspartyl-tRNA(Asn)/glutamyl-tRNA(Gln) amidotransferase subunit B